MKLNIFAILLLVLGLNINIIASGNGSNNGGDGTAQSCHDDCVSSEFSQK